MVSWWAAKGLLRDARRHRTAIGGLFSKPWPIRASLDSSQATLYSTEDASQATLPSQEDLPAGREAGFTQNDTGFSEIPWFAPPEGKTCDFAAEMAFARNEDDDGAEAEDHPFPSRPQWRCRDDASQHTSDVLPTGMLSKQLMNLPSHSSVLSMLQRWRAEGHPFSKNIVIVALTNLKREGRYKQALELANFVWKERVFVMDDVDHMYRLYLMGQTGSIEDVEKCFASIPFKWLTEKVYNQLISCYIARNMLPQAKNTLEKLKTSGQSISALPYNQFMTLYRHQRQPRKALELIKDMKASNVSPDTRTYNLLLSTICKQNDADGVLKNYKAMKDAGIVPDILTYSLVAKAYISAGMMGEAESLASEMKKLNSKNSHLAHDLLLTVYAVQGKHEDLKRTWKDLERVSDPSARSYGVMIESLGKLGLVKEAQKLAFKAEKRKQKLPARVYNAMMDVYGRHGMVQEAEDLMTRIRKDGLKANCVTYRHLVSGYLKVSQVDKALEYLRTSKQIFKHEYSKPWFESFLLILDHLAEKGEKDVAERTFQYFTTSNSYRDTSAYNILLKAYVKAKISAPNFLQRMSADGVQPDAKTLALLAELESLQAMH